MTLSKNNRRTAGVTWYCTWQDWTCVCAYMLCCLIELVAISCTGENERNEGKQSEKTSEIKGRQNHVIFLCLFCPDWIPQKIAFGIILVSIFNFIQNCIVQNVANLDDIYPPS